MSPFLHPPADVQQAVVIYEDGGGDVDRYTAQARRYTSEGRRVEIRGSCRSACVLALSVPGVCVSETAVVKAHYAYEQWTGVVRPDVTEKMLSALPRAVYNRLSGQLGVNYTRGATLGYEDLRSLGVPDCRSAPRIAAKPTSVFSWIFSRR